MKPDEIKQIRKLFDVSQERFARLLGTTVVSVNRWEKGKTKPSRIYVKALVELRRNHGSYVSRRNEFEES